MALLAWLLCGLSSACASAPPMALGPAGRSALPPRPATQAAAKPPVELSEADFCEDAAEVGEVWFGSQLALARSAAGVAVGWVTPDSPAALAGIEPGDFIFQVDGANVDDATDIWSEVVRAGAGASLRLGVHRAGQMRLLRVALTTRPALEASSSGATQRGPENARTAWTP